MIKEKVNKILMYRIGYSKAEDIEELRKIYKNIIIYDNEQDFLNSVLSWFFDGNAPYYDSYLEKEWK